MEKSFVPQLKSTICFHFKSTSVKCEGWVLITCIRFPTKIICSSKQGLLQTQTWTIYMFCFLSMATWTWTNEDLWGLWSGSTHPWYFLQALCLASRQEKRQKECSLCIQLRERWVYKIYTNSENLCSMPILVREVERSQHNRDTRSKEESKKTENRTRPCIPCHHHQWMGEFYPQPANTISQKSWPWLCEECWIWETPFSHFSAQSPDEENVQYKP
jgi:hypothetical protein